MTLKFNEGHKISNLNFISHSTMIFYVSYLSDDHLNGISNMSLIILLDWWHIKILNYTLILKWWCMEFVNSILLLNDKINPFHLKIKY